jgi:hypothetical protein
MLYNIDWFYNRGTVCLLHGTNKFLQYLLIFFFKVFTVMSTSHYHITTLYYLDMAVVK